MSNYQSKIEDLYSKISLFCNIKLNENIGKTSWIGTGGFADFLLLPESEDQLSQALKIIKKIAPEFDIKIIGARSNIIIRMGGVRGIVVLLRKGFTDVKKIDNDTIFVSAGALDLNVANYCAENSISGMEFLVGIPGTIGGNIKMNAGCYGSEIQDIFVECRCVDFYGNVAVLKRNEMNFQYRHLNLSKEYIFTSAILKGSIKNSEEIYAKMNEINEKRKKTQPIGRKTVGSTFKNPKLFSKESWKIITNEFQKSFDCILDGDGNIKSDFIYSWMLIDSCGLRGFKIGDAEVSTIHCNFLVNDGNATSKDFEDLGEFVIKKVEEKFLVKLEWEVDRIGEYL